jgi:Transglycosylase SLT domain
LSPSRLWFVAPLVFVVPLPGIAQTSYTPAQLAAIAEQDAQQYGVPIQLLVDQITAESDWNPDAVSSSGAEGIAQILPSTAADPGYGIAPVDPTDPVASLAFAAQYDAALYAANGDSWVAALTAYTGGLTPSNPGDYATVFEDAEGTNCAGTLSPDCGEGLGPVPAGTGTTATAGGDGLTVSTSDTGTGSTTAAATPATSTSGGSASFNPFSYLWNQYSAGVS